MSNGVKQRINVNIYPSSGFVFRDADGTMHRGRSWDVVIQKVISYRQRNNMTVGNAEEEVMQQACERYPSLCRDPNTPRSTNPLLATRNMAAPPPPSPRVPAELKARVLMWLAEKFGQVVRKEPVEYVPHEEFRQRLAICAACPQNQPIITGTGCSSCKKAMSDYRDAIIPGRERTGLGGCNLLGTDLVTAVHLEVVRVDNNVLPGHCWNRVST